MRHLQNLQCGRTQDSNRRTKGRVVSLGLRCPLGTLDDVSSGGLRIITRRHSLTHVGHCMTVDLRGDDLRLWIPARVVWARKHSLLKSIVGMEWITEKADPEALSALLKYVSRENATSWRPAA